MHPNTEITFQVQVRLHRFKWIQVHVFHKPAGLIGTDGQQRQPESIIVFTGSREMLVVSGVAGKVDIPIVRPDHKRPPERLHLIT